VTSLDHLNAVGVELVKVVRGVGHLVRLDAHESKILNDSILELLLLVRGVGVIEAL
jgi:hypothetical protein